MYFEEHLSQKADERKFVCVGIDPNVDSMPPHLFKQYDRHSQTKKIIQSFADSIIEATADIAACYKLNLGWWFRNGLPGISAMFETVKKIHDVGSMAIVDAKCGDVPHTNLAWAKGILGFKEMDADALTVVPYIDFDAIERFLEYTSKGVFVLCKSSDGHGVQDFFTAYDYRPTWKVVVEEVADQWTQYKNWGLIVGIKKDDVHTLESVRQSIGDNPFILVPGVGAQGGSASHAATAASNRSGKKFIINSSRKILYASSDTDFADAARRETEILNEVIRSALAKKQQDQS